jgi:threonine dehydratase
LTYRLVNEIALVEDQEIIEAMRVFWEEEQLMIEGSAAVGLAAVLSGKLNIKKQKTVLVLTGRNINWERYRLLLGHGYAF